MNRRVRSLAGACALTALGVVMGLVMRDGILPESALAAEAEAADASNEASAATEIPRYSPVNARARDFYSPNSEDLGPDEMRLIACGTGMPTARPKQAASCRLLELGNGDKFIFDVCVEVCRLF